MVNVECNLYFRLVVTFQVALGNLKQFFFFFLAKQGHSKHIPAEPGEE